MKNKTKIISCNQHYRGSCRINPFEVVEYKFNYESNTEDRDIIDNLLNDAEDLASKVYSGAANDSTSVRDKNRILANCIAGVISEYCWKHYLNKDKKVVQSTKFESASNQIDLEIITNKKKIEVRSSFPRRGLEFAICHPKYEFDVIGPYSNVYKPGEISKDYFIRTLFTGMTKSSEIIERVKEDNFTLYLTGGANYEMMFNPNLSKKKSLIPDDNLTISTPTSYRVVPFHNALDTAQIYSAIINEI